jgi:hypothetical protein
MELHICVVQINQNYFFLRQLTGPISITILYVDFIFIIFIDLCMSTGAQYIIQLLSVNINKSIFSNAKI